MGLGTSFLKPLECIWHTAIQPRQVAYLLKFGPLTKRADVGEKDGADVRMCLLDALITIFWNTCQINLL